MQPIIPGVVNDQTIRAVGPDDTALRAGQLMTEFDISAVVVCDEREQIVGIVTERDLSRRVVAENRTPGTTRVTDIMTADPRALAPDDSAFDALQVMRRLKIRHLPVVSAGRVVGMVSIRDLRQAINHEVGAAHRGGGMRGWLRRARK